MRESIVEVRPGDLAGYTQCHFFAGIGGWAYALKLAGWPEEAPVWTGSCPCQPFSVAGDRKGFKDNRHLWPEFFRLIQGVCPEHVFGEQVSGPAGLTWLDLVLSDLENAGYTGGRSICVLRARARRTSDSASIGAQTSELWGWRTPTASDGMFGVMDKTKNTGRQFKLRDDAALSGWLSPTVADTSSGLKDMTLKGQGQFHLKDNAHLSGWATVTTQLQGPASNLSYLSVQANHAGWPTVCAQKAAGCRDNGKKSYLPEKVEQAGWPTLTVNDIKDAAQSNQPTKGLLRRTVWLIVGEMSGGAIAEIKSGDRLNHQFCRWLMGFPEEWDSCGVTAMQSCRKSRRGSSKRTCKSGECND